jgi:hypothetical protein
MLHRGWGAGRVLHSSTIRLNVSAFRGARGSVGLRGCLGGIHGVGGGDVHQIRRLMDVLRVTNGSC